MRASLSPRRWQLDLVFYVLAVVSILTVVATIYLSEVSRGTVRRFAESNQFWADRFATVAALQQAAVDLNLRAKPAGKLDEAAIGVRRRHAMNNFDSLLRELQGELQSRLTRQEAPRLAAQVADIADGAKAMVAASAAMLDRSAAGDPEGARAAIGAMDRHLSRITGATGGLHLLISQAQRRAFAEQERYAEDIETFKYAYAVIALIMVVGSVLFGTRIARMAREAEENRRNYLASTEAREKDLQLANERLEATVVARTAELQSSEGKFRTLVRNIPGACYRCADDADYTMEFISDAIVDICGHPANDFIGNRVRTYASIIHPDDVAMVADVVGAGLRARKQYTIEYRVRHADGSVHWVYEKGQGVFGPDGALLHVDGAILDITERKHIEQTRDESEARKGAVLQAAMDCIVSMDKDGRILDFNPAAEITFGYRADEVIGRRLADVIIPPAMREAHARYFGGGRLDVIGKRIEIAALHRDGSGFPIELTIATASLNGAPIFIGFMRDIAARRRMETELARVQSRLADALESIGEGFILWDAEERLVLCNSKYKELFAPSADLMVVGRSFEEIVRAAVGRGQYPDARNDPEAWVQDRLRRHRAATGAFELELADGRWLRITDRRTTEGGVAGIRTDITERKRAELDLREANDSLRAAMERLANSERLAMIGQVAATVSHELRNPLGAIRNSMAYVRQLTANKQLGVERALERVDRNIERCTSIISDLLEFARKKEFERAPTPIDAWLAETLDDLPLPEAVLLERDLRARAEIAIDRDKFRQVVVNLVENAAQALKDPAWEPPPEHPRRITVRSESAGPHVRISVADSGPGIPEQVLPRIFEPLFTTKSFGIGLGLPMVRQIVEQHGGTIDVASAAGAGATFTVFLPRRGEAAQPPNDAAARGAAA